MQKYDFHRKEDKSQFEKDELCDDRFYKKVIFSFSLFSTILMDCWDESLRKNDDQKMLKV